MRQSQTEALQASLIECQRFVRAAKRALEKHEENVDSLEGKRIFPAQGVAASLAATKRASMDLTRALARFRRA